MSTAIGYSGPDRLLKKSAHRRNDSGELDVFEAARYFSGLEATGVDALRKGKREERPALEGYSRGGGGGARKSLDVSMQGSLPGPDQPHRIEKSNKEKKSKQPSSPGGRLASFLNSLFSQTSSKKKSKSTTSKSVKDDDESPLGRRKRRSSISHFQSVSSNSITNDTKSVYSSSRSGFRTPPAYSNTPTKVFKDQKIGGPLSKYNAQPSPLPVGPRKEALGVNKDMSLGWLDEKFKFSDGFLEKNRIVIGNGLLEKGRGWAGGFSLKEELRKGGDDVEDGGESDSSSDLFELQNYDLGVYSNGLPVYETTRMESIRRGAPIASGTL